MSQEALKLALELLAVATFHSPELQKKRTEVIEAGLEALANHCEDNLNMVKQEQGEPVAQCMEHGECFGGKCIYPQPKQEPMAMQMDVIVVNLVREGINKHRARELAEHFIKTATPQQRTWVGLTDKELEEFSDMKLGGYDLCLEVEAKLKEKNT